MANRPVTAGRTVYLEHAFDRLAAVKIEQAYGLLVPAQTRTVSAKPQIKEKNGVFQLSFTLFRPHDVFGDLSYSLIY
jgi:hypothetical protein